ncbi:hypothetical protein NPIL_678181 [Nephila pilipes]|uniref:Uncharacterized protein n=1 Tax=Nephila pilipes TaxID=299642 RepID=A0A8X6KET0_NEPPI|nr:hypothetical protein NPIL_678181 [Nephila pilipes]
MIDCLLTVSFGSNYSTSLIFHRPRRAIKQVEGSIMDWGVLSGDNSIVYPYTSSPASRDNSNVVDNDIKSTYNDETLFRISARDIDSSKNENSRGVKPALIPSPKRAFWYVNPRVIGQPSSHETDIELINNGEFVTAKRSITALSFSRRERYLTGGRSSSELSAKL